MQGEIIEPYYQRKRDDKLMSVGTKKKKVILKSGRAVSVAKKNYSSESLVKSGVISSNDLDMDVRVVSSVSMAIKKAKILGAPIARYNKESKKAYLEYADGRKEIIE